MSALLLAAVLACHFSDVCPVVSDWTVGISGNVLSIDAKLAQRTAGFPPPDSLYFADGEAFWVLDSDVYPNGGLPERHLDARHATVTDSTLHFSAILSPGRYVVFSIIWGGNLGEDSLCHYERSDTVTVLSTPNRRKSWGGLKSKYRTKP